jgi:signal transduction histidine kinase
VSADIHKQAYLRERQAHQESERLLEDKTRDLYLVNQRLTREVEHGRELLQELELTRDRLLSANSKLEENQAQLVQSEKMAGLGQLAAGVAHEINNPVSFIMSNIATLTEYVAVFKKLLAEYETVARAAQNGGFVNAGVKDPLERIARIREEEKLEDLLSDVDGLLDESKEGTRRVKDIVQGLKSFARMDESERKEANVNDCIEDTLKLVWNELKYKCEVRRELGGLPHISCNPGQLNQVFMNLLVNAAQAIPVKGTITVETKATDEHVVVRISDTGTGISRENLRKVFDPFFTTKPVGKGTGLGLSIAHGIIEKHQGTIKVESEVGKGTTFIIRLPLKGLQEG